MELLVSMFVVGILVALLLPGIQAVRESGRRVQCQNNLRQLSAAVLEHENAFNVLPSDGWGWLWLGEPDRGTGVKQPGGWMYQVLPYVDRNDLRIIGSGLPDPLRRLALADLSQSGMPTARCPSRAAAEQCPRDPLIVWFNAELRPTLSRSDYAGNAGDFFYGIHNGPATLQEGESVSYSWPDTRQVTGVLYLRSQTRMSDIADGATSTYLIGEKYVSRAGYNSYSDPGYDQSIASGDDWDEIRWTDTLPLPDGVDVFPTRFGSAHAAVFNMALCDGSVRSISYSIDSTVHGRLGNRKDHGAVSAGF